MGGSDGGSTNKIPLPGYKDIGMIIFELVARTQLLRVDFLFYFNQSIKGYNFFF